MDTLEEMDRFLDKFNLPRLNQEEIDIMSNPITSTEVEALIKNLLQNKSPGQDGFTGEFYQTFREDIMPILPKLFQKISEEGTLQNSFYEVTITLIPKPNKDKSEGPYSFKGQIYQTFKKLMLCLLKLFQKISEEGRLPNSFHEVTITLIPKPVTDNTQKEN